MVLEQVVKLFEQLVNLECCCYSGLIRGCGRNFDGGSTDHFLFLSIRQAGVASSNWLSVNARISVPSERITHISP